MADITLTTAQTSGFIPQFWANRALEVLRANIALAKLVAKDTDFGPGDFATQGSTLTIPYPGTFSAVDKTANTPVTPQAPVGGSSVQLTLSKHKVVPFLIEDFANAQANLPLMDRWLEPAVIAIAEQFEADLFSTYTGFTTTIGTAGTNLTGPTVQAARKAMNDAKVPRTDRSIVMSTKDEISLLADSSLATYFAFSQTQAIKEGSIGKLYGFDLFVSQLTPTVASAVIYTVSLGSPSAGTFTLTYGAQTTAGIAYNASAAAVQAALAALSTIGTGNVYVAGNAGGPYTVNFVGTLSTGATALTGSGAGLTGGTFAITQPNPLPTSTKNLAIHPTSIIYATRPFREPPADAGVMIATAVDPEESGLSIRIAAQYDINNMGIRCNLDMLYGFTNLRPNVGTVVLS